MRALHVPKEEELAAARRVLLDGRIGGEERAEEVGLRVPEALREEEHHLRSKK